MPKTEKPHKEVIADIKSQGGITGGGRAYGRNSLMVEFVAEKYYRSLYEKRSTPEYIKGMMASQQHNEDGLITDRIQLSSLEPYILDHLRVLDGDLSKLYEPGGRYIASVRYVDYYEFWILAGVRWATPLPSAIWRRWSTTTQTPTRFTKASRPSGMVIFGGSGR